MVIERAATDALSAYFERLVKSLDSHLAAHIGSTVKHLPESKILDEPGRFTHHPLEKELSALKKEQALEALKRRATVDLKIWKRLSSIDLVWLMFAIVTYLSWMIFHMNSQLSLLKSELENLKISLKKS